MPKPLFRASALTLVEVAMGETISMAMFRAGRRATQEHLSRAALERILTDEVRHQRLGWSALTAWWPDLPEEIRPGLQEEARMALGAMEQQMAAPALRHLDANVPFTPAYSALGVQEDQGLPGRHPARGLCASGECEHLRACRGEPRILYVHQAVRDCAAADPVGWERGSKRAARQTARLPRRT
jgi:hypothetical protein